MATVTPGAGNKFLFAANPASDTKVVSAFESALALLNQHWRRWPNSSPRCSILVKATFLLFLPSFTRCSICPSSTGYSRTKHAPNTHPLCLLVKGPLRNQQLPTKCVRAVCRPARELSPPTDFRHEMHNLVVSNIRVSWVGFINNLRRLGCQNISNNTHLI